MKFLNFPNLFTDSCCKPMNGCNSSSSSNSAEVKKIRMALAGNANVGKSALFNYLTGMHQHVANWPGKTVERAEGTMRYKNCEVDIIDLPGIYSLSTFSIEEKVSREHIVDEKPDVVVNVIDSCALERNLFFTIQLLELGAPVIIALNQTDVARKKGIEIDEKKLSKTLGVPVVKIVATTGFGIGQLLAQSCLLAEKKRKEYRTLITTTIKKSKRTERSIAELSKERYYTANKIAEKTQTRSKPKESLIDRIDELTTDRFFGYVIMLAVMGALFYSIFSFGDIASSAIGDFFELFRPSGEDITKNILWEGFAGGFVAGITLVLPYALPFYLLLSLLEDTGYITRIAYLLDGIAHRIGFHGKAVIPLILGYGCNVPACFGCRIMEYERDRFITAFAITLIPCTARTVVVLALVGAYLGPWWALGIYIFNLAIIALLAKIAFKTLPGEPMGLIMEMPPYRMPSLPVVMKHTWWKIKSILSVVFPYYMLGGLLFAIFYISGILTPINDLLTPLTQGWLGLPAFTATLLLFGIVRKELIVVLPAVLYNTTDLSAIFTPSQMIVLTVITLFYIPCLATIEALRREFGIKRALAITAFEIVFALLLGGVVSRILTLASIA